jgi:dUTP pyrophosphatase
MTSLDVEFKILDQRLGTDFPLPEYATEHSAGMDLRAMISDSLTLEPGSCHLIPTGMAIFIREPTVCAHILPRSGLGHKQGLVMGNGVGLIDADYQGPLMVSLWNRGFSTQIIQAGDRIAQLVFMPVIRARLVEVIQFAESARGGGGFGHTGVR